MKHLLARSFLVLAGLLLLVGCSSEAESQEPSDPAEVIKGYVAAYNAHDIDRAMKYFADDAVYVQGTDRFEGAVAIRAEVLLEFEVHAPGGDAYSISNLVVDGDTVTWDHRFKGVAHNCTGTGNEAVVDDGMIVTWTFAPIECD